MKQRRINIDFDNTLTEGDVNYWEGERPTPNEDMVEWARQQYHDHNTIVIWTARPWSEAARVAAHCRLCRTNKICTMIDASRLDIVSNVRRLVHIRANVGKWLTVWGKSSLWIWDQLQSSSVIPTLRLYESEPNGCRPREYGQSNTDVSRSVGDRVTRGMYGDDCTGGTGEGSR